MSRNFISVLEREIYYVNIDFIENSLQNKEENINKNTDIMFNGFDKKAAYIDFCQIIIQNVNNVIEKELKASVSRNKALYYIKQLINDFNKYKKSFSEVKAYNLSDSELFLYQHLKNAKQKLPEEFVGIKKTKYIKNKNVSYSPNFINGSKNIDRKFLNEFENSFASVQLAMLEELIDGIEKFNIFIESLSDKEFKSDYEFFEHKHPVLTLSETVKLTDKEVDIKIETLDKGQTALFFHYLERAKLILEYSITDKATFAHYLTGHGKRQLQQLLGENKIYNLKWDIENTKVQTNYEYNNLNKLKEQLNNIIKIIDNDITEMEEN